MSDGGRAIVGALGSLGGVALVTLGLALWGRSAEVALRMSDVATGVWATRAAAASLVLAGQGAFFGVAVPGFFSSGRLERVGVGVGVAGAAMLGVVAGILLVRAW